MIKFFRKIRHNLLSENKTGKYFKYAIGEIILVVIGILIALQINNWNQDRINDKKEVETLKALKNDVKTNYEQFGYYQNLVRIKRNTLIKILNGNYSAINYPKIDAEDSINGLFATRYQYALPIQDNTFKQTLGNENSTLIQSPLIKKAIFDYYTLIGDRKAAVKTGLTNWPYLLSSIVPGEYYNEGIETYPEGVLNSYGEELLLKKLKTDLEILRPAINAEIQFSIRADRNLIRLKKEANELLELLDAELIKKK